MSVGGYSMTRSIQLVSSQSLPPVRSAMRAALTVESFLADWYASPTRNREYISVLDSLSGAALHQIQSAEKNHLVFLLAPSVEEEQWSDAAHALGEEHARLGFPIEWIAESHRLFLCRITAAADTLGISEGESEPFRSMLADRLLHDLSMQSAAYDSTSGKNGMQGNSASEHNKCIDSLHRALMGAAELVVRARSDQEMMDELCRLLVDDGLFAQVWIAKPNIVGDLKTQSIFGIGSLRNASYLVNIDAGNEEDFLAVRAWRHSRLQYSNNRLAEPGSEVIHDFFEKNGLHATAVLPLYRDGGPWALLTLISRESNLFRPETVELLERIGRLIGHGLDSLDLRQVLEDERQHQAWLARHDTVTDTLNRRGVLERIAEATSRARRHKKMLAVAVLDIEGFKRINDLHGHPAGDLLLRTIADRMQATLRQTDAVGRLGGDEFVFMLEDMDRPEDLDLMMTRVQASVEATVHLIDGRTAAVRSSIGITLFPEDDSSPERLLRHAERALSALRSLDEEPAQRWMVFHPESDEQRFVHQKTILMLFRTGNLRVHYQPVVDLQTGEVSGVEALARLAAEDGSLLPPADFLPQLTDSDMVALTHQVMAQSILDLRRIDSAGFELSVGINFEPATLADKKAMLEIRRQVETSGLDPSRIMLELLERADALSLAGSQQALRDLKSSGARVALDDVGSAYSSLLRVKDLPVDIIKLDRSFMIGLERQPKHLRFLMNLVHLGHALELGMIVEGVESAASGDALAALGVRHAQGYSIARPMPIEDLLPWLQQHKPSVWKRPTSVLGTVALQLRDLDASERILEQRPDFLPHLLKRDNHWDREVGEGIEEARSAVSKLGLAHHAWHRSLEGLAELPDGTVDLASFQAARSLYEDKMFQAAIEALAG